MRIAEIFDLGGRGYDYDDDYHGYRGYRGYSHRRRYYRRRRRGALIRISIGGD